MGIKFRGSEVLGQKPLVADIGERELAINLADRKIYSKTAGGLITNMMGERAGVIYSATEEYIKGDMVSDGNVPALVFISLTGTTALPNKGNIPVAPLTADWQELDTNAYSAGVYTPGVGVETPNNIGEEIGATWAVTGLGVDPLTGDRNQYVTVAGGLYDLPTGTILRDNDRVMWVDGIIAEPIWLHVPAMIMSGERGGIAWASGKDYYIGDIVVENGITYRSLTGVSLTPNLGNTPGAVGDTDWHDIRLDQRVGTTYDNTYQYEVGDTFTYNGEVYVVEEDPLNPPNAPTAPGPLDPTDGSDPSWGDLVEAGGDYAGAIYDPTHQYEIGDTFTYNGEIIIVGEDPSTPGVPPLPGAVDPTDTVTNPEWASSAPATSAEQGGVAWKLGASYLVGDITTQLGVSYLCNVDHVSLTGDVPLGSPTQANATSWDAFDSSDIVVDVAGWTSGISAATGAETALGTTPPYPTTNPVIAGVTKDIQTVLNLIDDFMDPGKY